MMMIKAILLALTVTACIAVPSNIVRPCKVKSNNCLRQNLAANSYCNPNVRGFIPSEYKIDKFKFDTPFFNATYIDNDLIIRNHDKCFITEFFYNLGSDSAVISLDCPMLGFQSTRTLIQHYTRREDGIFSFNYNGTYPMVRLTVNLPHANALNLCNSFTFADVTALPIFYIDPNDKKTANFLTQDLTFLNIYERESFFYRANQLLRYFINSVVCDFGCNF